MTNNSDVFDRIAPGWYNFRHWSIFRRELEALAQRWKGGRLLNLGCAHGPDFLPFRDNFALHGVDFSAEMLRLARRYAQKFRFDVNLARADVRHLPFRDGNFQWALSVATYHHLDSREGRLQALRELRRVLRPGGEAFITVWNRWQSRFWFRPADVRIPWRGKDKTEFRYYHLFSYGEMEGLCGQAGLVLLRSFPESSWRWPVKIFSRNICLLVKRL